MVWDDSWLGHIIDQDRLGNLEKLQTKFGF